MMEHPSAFGPRRAAETPRWLGGYQLLVPIGTGGMGSVYLAQREVVPGVRRLYAVKVIHPSLGAEPSVGDQLLAEARLAARVEHPNVVAVREVSSAGSDAFLVMDYVEGDTLGGLIARAGAAGTLLPIDVVGRILCDALVGLHAAHEARDDQGHAMNLVHRDFSPQNILVGVDGISRLTDFGIAKAIDSRDGTATGTIKGKVSYMAPEQATGEPLDRRCDIWSAGVVAWEALAGRRLFAGKTDAERILKIVSGAPPRRVSSERPEVSAEIDEVVSSALSRDRRQRVPDALALRNRCEAAFSDFGIASHDRVAALVRELCGDSLDRRRAQVEEARKASEAEPEPVSGMTAQAVELQLRAGTTHRPVAAAARARWRPWVVAFAVAALGTTGWSFWRRAPQAVETLQPRLATLQPRLDLGEAPLSASAPPSRAALSVRADAPIAQLRVGDQSIPLRTPDREVRVPLSEEERARDLRLLVVAADGRRADIDVPASESAVTVRFSGKPYPRRAVRQPRDDGPRLAPVEYGK